MTPEAARAAVQGVLDGLGGVRVDPPATMPAHLPLELSGEAVRTRLCVFTDANGGEIALRPDLTLPVALSEVERRRAGENDLQTWTYDARAFRLPAGPGEPIEFIQCGFERYGAPSGIAEDVAAFSDVMAAIEAVGAPVGTVRLGDLGVFAAFVDALDLPEATAGSLKRAFRQHGGVARLLGGQASGAPTSALAAHLAGMDADSAEAVVRDMLGLSGVSTVGMRTPGEIAERLIAKGNEGAANGVPEAAAAVLGELVEINAAPDAALAQLNALVKRHKLNGARPAVDALSARLEGLAAICDPALCSFDTTFGRRFTYYDGFVFEVFGPGAPDWRPFGAGGRYDTLLAALSDGEVSASGIGGVVRPERLAAAAGART